MSRVRRVGWWLAIVSSVSHAEVTLDGSMGPAGPLPGPEFQVEARFGRQVGNNLFHSFGVFRLNSAQIATFNDVGAMGSIENILGRVTGPTVSNIDGAIKTSFQNSTPNLFLLNPAGLVFGPNATLDVQGSFYASTADSIKLADGVQFDAVPTANDALLTTAPPSAFRFLAPDQPELTVSGSALRVPAGESLSFVGKSDPTVFPGTPLVFLPVKVRVRSGILDAPEGRVDVIQARSNSEVSIEKPNSPPLPERDLIRPANFNELEDLLVHTGAFTVTGGAQVGKEGGNITVDVAKLALRDGGSLDTTPDSGNAGDIEVNATDSVSLAGRKDSLRSVIGADVSEDGNAGHIRISAPRLELSDSGISASVGEGGGTGGGGTIELEVENLSLSDGAVIQTINVGARMGGEILINAKDSVVISGRNPANPSNINSATRGEGDAGRVFVKAGRLTLRDGGTISTEAEGGSGNAGEIRLEADELFVKDGGSVRSTTRAEGRGGRIFVSARDIGIHQGAISTSSSGVGDAGEIELHAQNLTIKDGGSLSSTTERLGRGGAITVDAPGGEVTVAGKGSAITTASLMTGQNAGIAGPAGRIMIEAGRFVMRDGGEVSASTETMGKGGDLQVIADSVLLDGPKSRVSVDSQGSGDSGDLRLTANDALEITNQAAISAETSGPGKGGSVDIDSPDIRLISGGTISTASSGVGLNRIEKPDAGQAGDVSIDGRGGTVSLSGQSTAITSETSGDGDAGSVAIRAGRLTVSDGAEISASTSGNGKGGNVNIQAANIELLNGGAIAASSDSTSDRAQSGSLSIRADDTIRIFNDSSINVRTRQADAGNITLKAGFLLHLKEKGEISTSARGGEGNGGNINIDPVFTVLDGGSSITARAARGRGGRIEINTNFLFGPRANIDASSDEGISGTVEIDSPDTDVISSALELPGSFLDAASLLSDRCSARTQKGASSFIVSGRGGVPPGPETVLPSQVELGATREEGRSHDSTSGSLSNTGLALSPVAMGCSANW